MSVVFCSRRSSAEGNPGKAGESLFTHLEFLLKPEISANVNPGSYYPWHHHGTSCP